MAKTTADNNDATQIPKCGIVMPISPIDGLPGEHWAEVLGILKDIIKSINLNLTSLVMLTILVSFKRE